MSRCACKYVLLLVVSLALGQTLPPPSLICARHCPALMDVAVASSFARSLKTSAKN